MILLWGQLDDGPFRAVVEQLAGMGAPFVVLDTHTVLESEVSLEVDGLVRGELRTSDTAIALESVTAGYFRPDDFRLVPAVASGGPTSIPWAHARSFHQVLWTWADVCPIPIVNPPAAQATNGSKPYQLSLIRELGFDIPHTLVTSNPKAARDFCQYHGTVIYKSTSAVRSVVARLSIARREHMEDLTVCPTQFQEYIPGVDYRVHVVDEELFCCSIRSSADDYRYDRTDEIELRPARLPVEVADGCRALAKGLELLVAGIDLRRTPGGRWYCFEVNPSPAFTFYDRDTEQPIARAVAQLLARPPAPVSHSPTGHVQTPR